MSFMETLRQWDEAVSCAEKKNISEALQIFQAIEDPNSKIFFDIGCLHLSNQDLDAAEKAFDRSIGKDEHLAVAFFQRGIMFYTKERYEESLADFQHALRALRGNQLIDYKALGLRYILYACEVLHNMALVQAHLGDWDKAKENLVKALDYKTEAKMGIIDNALQSLLKQKLFKLVRFPCQALFKPNKSYVAQLEKKDYLGKAKVLASVVPQDEFSGFSPLGPRLDDESPASPKTPEVLRALEGEAHTVLFEFIPQNKEELAVVPGNIVFVLNKGSDNWASVIFNERRGLVPYNYLERLEINAGYKKNNETSENQNREPPTIPTRKADSAGSGADSKVQGREGRNNSSCVVKVRFKYTFAVCMLPGAPFTTLADIISKKLGVPAPSIILSLESRPKKAIIDASTSMRRVWARASGGRLTLWCWMADEGEATAEPEQTEGEQEQKEGGQEPAESEKEPAGGEREQTDGAPQKQRHLVALHSYESTNPEDLTFHQGDSITLLSTVNQEWLEGQCNGITGIFPAAFAEEAPVHDQ